MGYNDHLRSSNDQATATFTDEQVNGDEYTREESGEDVDPRSQRSSDSYWNYTED